LRSISMLSNAPHFQNQCFWESCLSSLFCRRRGPKPILRPSVLWHLTLFRCADY